MSLNIAIVGASGFVGTALTLAILDQGHRVRTLTRTPHKWPLQHNMLDKRKGDVKDTALVQDFLSDMDVAYFLVHGLGEDESDFEYNEAKSATSFARAANKAKIKKIIYLGGLGPEIETSPHLRSRQLTGEILGLGTSPCLEFRASIVLGANSTSFEMVKALVHRLPFRPYANWLETPCQPIALQDLVSYLMAGLELKVIGHQVVELGCPQVVSYGDLLDLYAQAEGLPRQKLLLPRIDQRLLLPLLDVAIPEFADVGKKLFMSLAYPTVVTDKKAEELFPDIIPMSVHTAMTEAARQSSTEYPAVWEGDFWKELRDQTLLQSKQGQEILLLKLRQLGEIAKHQASSLPVHSRAMKTVKGWLSRGKG